MGPPGNGAGANELPALHPPTDENPGAAEARWQAEIESADYHAAPYFYWLAVFALVSAGVADRVWLPRFAGTFFWVRVALMVCALVLLAAVRTRRLGDGMRMRRVIVRRNRRRASPFKPFSPMSRATRFLLTFRP